MSPRSAASGFPVDHFAARFGDATARLVGWMREDRLVLPEQVERGIEAFPAALVKLFSGAHRGKLLVEP